MGVVMTRHDGRDREHKCASGLVAENKPVNSRSISHPTPHPSFHRLFWPRQPTLCVEAEELRTRMVQKLTRKPSRKAQQQPSLTWIASGEMRKAGKFERNSWRCSIHSRKARSHAGCEEWTDRFCFLLFWDRWSIQPKPQPVVQAHRSYSQ